MGKEPCEACGHESELWALERHHVVPIEVLEHAGIVESKTVRLCRNCRRELEEWYLTKVTNIAYDLKTKRFRAKSWPEMAREYEYAYHSFVEYKWHQKELE